MLPFEGGEEILVSDLVDQALTVAERDGVEGITLLGGEPTAQAEGAVELSRKVRAAGLSVMVFSGFTLEELRESSDPSVLELLDQTDLLVDGPYRKEEPESTRRWIGSSNQRVHALTDRYRLDDPCWQRPNTLEIRLDGSTLTLNGFPGRSAVGLWKRPKVRPEGRS
jgi:anaerobic ribonucleoside-triphosphate reductase activating protein